MASQLAMQLTKAGLDAKDGLIQDSLDIELTEVREVLFSLASWPRTPCWCRVYHDDSNEKCKRARALYEKLRTDK